ncbi:hypothetical protein E2562_009450 [Oryza meyeriana var. granulata]|uniref:Cyclic nucleotide-binding domain-containing protein n=1 Tax=Oryza meyeriana var. granulata TaxID=110450 RepID=A0A6G1BV54_9ORYZ|nr:hypothetical protein E2562_009450 [Oryza meyeriana var. granulata]
MDREEGKAAPSLPNLGVILANPRGGCHWCTVTEFLGQVPLLQCLPGSSIRRIADSVLVKRYEPGDYVARQGEPVDGLYIILDGQAEVSAPAHTEEENRPDYVLNKYDYFGYGTNNSVHQVNVTAVSKLTCFVLPNQYGYLLQPKTIWNAEETPENHSLLEQILHLQPLEALAAASKTVDYLKVVHKGRISIKLQLYLMFLLQNSLNYWFRARGRLSDDPALHRFAIL